MHRATGALARPARRCFSSGASTKKKEDVVLNRYSRLITQNKTQGASQAMLYATEGIDSEADLAKPMVGVANVWYEGNPCVFSLSLYFALSGTFFVNGCANTDAITTSCASAAGSKSPCKRQASQATSSARQPCRTGYRWARSA